jgi:hypothetical protein
VVEPLQIAKALVEPIVLLVLTERRQRDERVRYRCPS